LFYKKILLVEVDLEKYMLVKTVVEVEVEQKIVYCV